MKPIVQHLICNNPLYLPAQRWGSLAVCLLLAVGLTTVPALADDYPEPGTNADLVLEVDINSADADTLAERLDGVGPNRAAAIVDWRQTHGPFESPDDLLSVSGIGPATLDTIRDQIVIDSADVAAE
ncbi:helix-hairpin-helix domain-containing protein [Natronospirillum operosum]|uniref:Helix-hairpin-helix domain-containing protein n=1 Tax=Natronospirillum operosum TaxID=2759953 RepID=A0A4Z0WIQ3_9GAMM|nr:helix-hairpin-helix domain-containing protein [Natronospirillum operosum]TGG95521.1 helix-hairpin-helix domain-containing protein [Natronospirillum operosum]